MSTAAAAMPRSAPPGAAAGLAAAVAAWWRRAGPLPLLAAAVLALHLTLMAGLWPSPRLAPGHAAAPMALRSVQLLPPRAPVAPAPRRAAAPDAAQNRPVAIAEPVRQRPSAVHPAPSRSAAAAAMARDLPGGGPGRAPPADPGSAALAGAQPADPGVQLPGAAPRAAPAPPRQATDPGDDRLADAEAAAAAAAAGAGQAPPVYPTRVPAPTLLRYNVLLDGRPGQATLRWQHDGSSYRLQLEASGAAGVLVEQSSSGGFDAAGLAPERFVDRRRGRSSRSANFRRDIGRIAFSGPRVDYPAWPGAQDRLSWIVQLGAILANASDAPLRDGSQAAPLRLFVVDARGLGDVWRFDALGTELLDTPMGPTTATRWRRDPPRPEGLRVEAWLDASRGHWPVRLRMTALRSGQVFELALAAEPVDAP